MPDFLSILVISFFLLLFFEFIGFAEALGCTSIGAWVEHPNIRKCHSTSWPKTSGTNIKTSFIHNYLRTFFQLKVEVLTPYEHLDIRLSKYCQLRFKCYCVWSKWVTLSCKIMHNVKITLHQMSRTKSQNSYLVKAHPSFLNGSDRGVCQVDEPFSWFKLFNWICCLPSLDLIFCGCSLFLSILTDRIKLLIGSDVSSSSYCCVSWAIFVQNPSVSFTQFSYSA